MTEKGPEQNLSREIEKIKVEIEKKAKRANVLWQHLPAKDAYHAFERSVLLQRRINLPEIDAVGNRGSQTPIEYITNFLLESIGNEPGTLAQKLDDYKILLVVLDTIEKEIKEAVSEGSDN